MVPRSTIHSSNKRFTKGSSERGVLDLYGPELLFRVGESAMKATQFRLLILRIKGLGIFQMRRKHLIILNVLEILVYDDIVTVQ